MIENNRYDRAMTTLATLAGRGNGKTAAQPLDVTALAMAASPSLVAAGVPGSTVLALTANLEAWTNQDDDAHDTCDSLVACRNPLHPGPCKGWKHTLHSVSPHIYKQMEEERVRKANARRLKRIADLKAQNKPIPRRLLEEIKPKPAPTHPAHGAQPVPLGQVNQKADLAGGQAHAAGQAVSNAAGVQVKAAPPLPLGPKGKKPTVAGRGPAFVITQPKVTDTYKLDKAAKITPQEWSSLSAADKQAIRDELEAIKVRGFGPQQKKADDLLAKLPAGGTTMKGTLAPGTPGTPGTITTPKGNVHQVINLPGKTTLGQATKTLPPTPQSHASVTHVDDVKVGYTWTDKTGSKNVITETPREGKIKGFRMTSQAHGGREVLASPKQFAESAGLDYGPRTPKAPSPSVPVPTNPPPSGGATGGPLSQAAQHARAVAGRGVPKASMAKTHIDAYGKLSKDDFDSLDANTQRRIRDDLANAKGKFLDPAKQKQAQDLLDRFGAKHTSPTPGAPAVPAHPKGYSDPQQQAMKAVQSGSTDDVLQRVGQLSHSQIKGLDDADRRDVNARLAFIATHPKASQEQRNKAASLGRIITQNIGHPGKLDHEPTLNEIHAEHVKNPANHPDVQQALAAADATTGTRADRVDALAKVTKQQFDALKPDQQEKITRALNDLHHDNAGYQKIRDAADRTAEDTMVRLTGAHPAVQRLRQAEADFRAGKITPDDLLQQFRHARVQTPVGHKDGAKLAAEAQRIAEDNPSLPLWLRATLIENPYGSHKGRPYEAISTLSMKHMWDPAPRLNRGDIDSIFAADTSNSHPIHQEAVREFQRHIISTGLDANSPWSTATKDQVVNAVTGTSYDQHVIPQDRMDLLSKLPAADQMKVRVVLGDRLLAQTSDRAKTGTNITLRQLQGRPYTGTQLDAALAATKGYPGPSELDAYRKLDPADFQSMAVYTRRAIGDHLDEAQQRLERNNGATGSFDSQSNALKEFPAALKAQLDGTRTAYADRGLRNASDVANYGTKLVLPENRIAIYRNVPIGQYKRMSADDQKAIADDLRAISTNTSLPLGTRYDAQFVHDVGHASNLNLDQLVAVGAAHPAQGAFDGDFITALHSLSKADYDGLDKTFREGIDARIKTLPGSDQQFLSAKFGMPTPANNPSGLAPTVQASVPPHVQEALDTIYGVHPKSHTMAHQLKTYGALRGSDFHLLNQQEQQHLLSDLSFIHTTAKGPSQNKAKLLIDRFTPAGTPSGTIPTPAVIPPANALPGQVRYATPLHGLFKAKNGGQSGDRWITTPGGKRVWGAHGAAGMLIKHTDPVTGEDRYLMVQRGPAISDPGKWTFPGGAIDSLETPHQGATRETIEELGLKDDQFKDADVHGDFTYSIPGSTWKYTSVAVSVPKQFQPDLSNPHARAETSDAKWLTLAEIRALDRSGDLHHPIAGGQLEKNVISLYPPGGGTKLGQVARPGPVTKRQTRLTMPAGGRQAPAQFNAWPHAHKPSKGKNLVGSKADIDAMRQKVKQERVNYDGKTADGRLAAIGAMQGYDDTPTVLTKKEIDRLLASGDYIEAFRGVSGVGGSRGWRARGSSGGKTAEQINEEMRSGPAYYGTGIFGNGYYLATDRRVAQQYADGTTGSVVRMLIPKSAVTDVYDAVRRDAEAHSSPSSQAKGGRHEVSTFWDPGRWGAAKGLDGIEIRPHHRSQGGGGAGHVASHGKPAFNWLNRSVLILQKEPG